ncbi:MAG: FHA domain-containing protein, partial [Deltaproteobacteria bacterium]|nr:FHA domain-containing protein [Deltaproteobacteria bacterium]
MARIYYYSDEGELMEAVVGAVQPEVYIGRQATCLIRSSGQSVSRQHARIIWHEGRYVLEDLGSSNGTFFNGDRLGPHQMVFLVDDALFACGQFELRLSFDEDDFAYDAVGAFPAAHASAPQAAPPPPPPPPPPRVSEPIAAPP